MLLWWLDDPTALASEASQALADAESAVYVSAVSVWEAGVKHAAGRLSLSVPVLELAQRSGFAELPLSWAHGACAAELPRLHADPFDRMLVAQAQVERLVLVTRDPLVRQYDVASLPA